MRASRLPDCALLLVLLSGVAMVCAQFEDNFGPFPPRPYIPGAVSLGPAPPRRLPSRPRNLQGAPPPESATRPRARPPGRRLPGPLAPAPQPTPVPQFFAPSPALLQQRPLIQQQQEEPNIPPRPVIEDSDDDLSDELNSPSLPSFSPSPSPSLPPPPSPQPQRIVSTFRPERPAFRPEPRPLLLPTPAPELNYVSPARQQLRPSAVFKNNEESGEDEEEEEEEPRRKPVYNTRTKSRPTAAPEETQQYSRQSQTQYNRAQSVVRAPQKQTYSSGKQDDYEKPLRQHQRPKKPVAQVLRRYREDNPDGSITWGFENDDGSFKEETIGTDCVTYGKYGYIDPEGTRREYSYSTGVPCDKNKTDNEEQPSEGYVDYAENKYVMPNGDSIDLDKMVKNRARRPSSSKQYRSTN